MGNSERPAVMHPVQTPESDRGVALAPTDLTTHDILPRNPGRIQLTSNRSLGGPGKDEMPRQITEYRVFIATPRGLDEVRHAFYEELQDYNRMDALRRGVLFSPVGWEDTLPGANRPQALINQELLSCDHFLLVLWDRWGSPPDRDGTHSSGCEEELALAEGSLVDPAGAMLSIAVFFRAVEPKQLIDPGPQLCKVLDFKRKLEEGKRFLFTTFDDVGKFRKDLRRSLARWVHQHESGGGSSSNPSSANEDMSATGLLYTTFQPRTEVDPLLEQAESLARVGRLTDAEALFAQVVSSEASPDAFNRFGHFLRHLGRLHQAEMMYRRVGDLATFSEPAWSAESYMNLGLLAQTHGSLPKAESLFRQSLEVYERLGLHGESARVLESIGTLFQTRGDLSEADSLLREALSRYTRSGEQAGMARVYGILGSLARTRGDLENAESLQRKALSLHRTVDSKEGMARAYGSLGLLSRTRGDLKEAEKLHRKALDLYESLSRKEGMAKSLLNLGLISQTRGNFHDSEVLIRKALAFNEELGRKEGIARAYGNLGVICEARGQLSEAESLFRQALELNQGMGRKEGMALIYGNLGVIRRNRGDILGAGSYFRQALSLYEELHSKEGMARAYGNLGLLARLDGDLDDAESLHRQALSLHEELGRKEGMALSFSNLGVVSWKRNDLEAAEMFHKKAFDLEQELGRKEGMAIAFGNLGAVCEKREEFERAEELHLRALALHQEIGRKEGIALALRNLGVIYARNDESKARDFLDRSRVLYAEIGMTHRVKDVSRLLSRLESHKAPPKSG